jgi:hypothetical protein
MDQVVHSLKLKQLHFQLPGKFKGRFIGGEKWKNPRLEISRIKGNVLALVGATHLLTSVVPTEHSKNFYSFK